MSRNPYRIDGEDPSLKLSVFAFMDILGYRQMIRESERDGKQQEFLTALYKTLSNARGWLEDKDYAETHKFWPKDLYALKAFTDNIVIGWPIRDDGESKTGQAFSKLGYFQFVMAIEGFFVRGAISIGDAYVDDIAVFGDALVQAYDGEINLARDPRIILEAYPPVSGPCHMLTLRRLFSVAGQS